LFVRADMSEKADIEALIARQRSRPGCDSHRDDRARRLPHSRT
jgi:hypothetical protein